MQKIFIFTIILFLIPPAVYGQNIDSLSSTGNKFIVDSISITGNDITDQDIILRELTFGIGDTIDVETLDYNKERIFSLGIFTRVELIPEKLNSGTWIEINVDEKWYIYPLPFVELKDRDWDKISYGITLMLENFRGRNETVKARGALGYDPAFSLTYYIPYLFRKEEIFFNIYMLYSSIANISETAEALYGENFEQTFSGGSLTIGKRFGNFHRANVSLGFNYIESPVFIKGISASNSRIDRILSIGAGYNYDTRDLAQYPKEGIFGSINYQWKGLGIDGINYSVIDIDFREYRRVIGSLVAKWRFASRIAFGKLVPYFDYSYIGYRDRVRGHFNETREGHHSYISTLEFFHPIIKDINISLDFIPVIPKQLLSYRLALYGQIFGDTGVTKLRGQPLHINDFMSGYGFGLTLLILPYNILRVEMAFDEYSNSEIIFDLGLSF